MVDHVFPVEKMDWEGVWEDLLLKFLEWVAFLLLEIAKSSLVGE